MLSSMIGSGSNSGQPAFRRINENGTAGHWIRFESVPEHFSVFFPSDGVEATNLGRDSGGNLIPFHYLVGYSDQTIYLLMTTSESNAGHTDETAADAAVHQFIGGMNLAAKKAGVESVIARPVRTVRLGNYSGKQFNLTGPNLVGVVRVFSRQVGEQRQMYMMIVLSSTASESLGVQFLNSFKLSDN